MKGQLLKIDFSEMQRNIFIVQRDSLASIETVSGRLRGWSLLGCIMGLRKVRRTGAISYYGHYNIVGFGIVILAYWSEGLDEAEGKVFKY